MMTFLVGDRVRYVKGDENPVDGEVTHVDSWGVYVIWDDRDRFPNPPSKGWGPFDPGDLALISELPAKPSTPARARYQEVLVGDAMGPSGTGGITTLAACLDCGSLLYGANIGRGYYGLITHPVHDAWHDLVEGKAKT